MAMITEVRSPADWCGEEMVDSAEWRLPLNAVHQAEVLAALAQTDFPLPTLGPLLRRLAGDVLDGRGFGLVQDVPVAGLTERECEMVALGIARHVGDVVAQGPDDVPLLHVRDQGVDPAEPTTRSCQHSRRLGYHSDPTDVVALLCVRPAKSGGLSSVVSSVAVHNEIVRTRPDLAEVLYQPWWRDRRAGDGPDSFWQSPVYVVDTAGRMAADYGPDYIRSAQRGPQVPPLSETQLAAMAEIDRLNNEFTLDMDLKAGDMQFLNNGVTMHSRTEYVDHPEPARRRDLIRLWLNRT